MTELPRPRNIRRTWKVDVYAGWGDGPSATIYLGTHTITLSSDAHSHLTAEIDGEPQDTIDAAVWMLDHRENHVTLLSEVRQWDDEPAPVIGKARAGILHKIMGVLGLPSPQHYALCAAALAEPWPLTTLSDLSEVEARVVWNHLCKLYPRAREVAQHYRQPTQVQNAA